MHAQKLRAWAITMTPVPGSFTCFVLIHSSFFGLSTYNMTLFKEGTSLWYSRFIWKPVQVALNSGLWIKELPGRHQRAWLLQNFLPFLIQRTGVQYRQRRSIMSRASIAMLGPYFSCQWPNPSTDLYQDRRIMDSSSLTHLVSSANKSWMSSSSDWAKSEGRVTFAWRLSSRGSPTVGRFRVEVEVFVLDELGWSA